MSKAKLQAAELHTTSSGTASQDPARWHRAAAAAYGAGRWPRARRLGVIGQLLWPSDRRFLGVEAQSLFRFGDGDRALRALHRLCVLQPAAPLAWRMIAAIHHANLRSGEAVALGQRVLCYWPDSSADAYNVFHMLRAGFRDSEAERWLRIANLLAPARGAEAVDEAAFELGMLRLAQKRWAEGWPLYDHRLREKRSKPDPDRYPWPLWDGRPAPVRHLLIWGDQNIGDEIQFARMLPEAAPLVGRLTLESDPRLVPLLRRSFPSIRVVPRNGTPPQGPFDLQLPSGHLGGLFRAEPAAFERGPLPWLVADPDRARGLRDRYRRMSGGRPVIGIAWKSANKFFRGKNVGLPDWGPILRHRRALFLSVQYGAVDEDLAAAAEALGVPIARDCEIDPLADLDGFAAQLAALDLVISTSNSTVHQACALGRPVWSLIHIRPDWRWGLTGSRCPWFPTLRMYRQPERDRWEPAIERLGADLSLWLAERAT